MALEKRVFTIPELIQMGYSERELRCAVRIKDQDFATRPSNKRGSKWKINLEKYEAYRIKQTQIQQRENRYI